MSVSVNIYTSYTYSVFPDPPLSNCLCVDWTPYSGHKLVAAGFGNGKSLLTLMLDLISGLNIKKKLHKPSRASYRNFY